MIGSRNKGRPTAATARSLQVPTSEHLSWAIDALEPWQLKRLSKLSKVPWSTLRKLKYSYTTNPRLETVQAIAAHYRAALTPPEA